MRSVLGMWDPLGGRALLPARGALSPWDIGPGRKVCDRRTRILRRDDPRSHLRASAQHLLTPGEAYERHAILGGVVIVLDLVRARIPPGTRVSRRLTHRNDLGDPPQQVFPRDHRLERGHPAIPRDVRVRLRERLPEIGAAED